MDIKNLPVPTKIFAENKVGSLMLVGINHGYSEDDKRKDEEGVNREDPYKSFFSDQEVNDYRFRNKIVHWFKLWGCPLKTKKNEVRQFEKSIVQTNWMQTQSTDMGGKNIKNACLSDNESFIETCEILRPKLIIFFSYSMLQAFADKALEDKIKPIFGEKLGDIEWDWCKERERFKKNFYIAYQEYEGVSLIGVPHATAARGVSDEYIGHFKNEIGGRIKSWWGGHQKSLKLSH